MRNRRLNVCMRCGLGAPGVHRCYPINPDSTLHWNNCWTTHHKCANLRLVAIHQALEALLVQLDGGSLTPDQFRTALLAVRHPIIKATDRPALESIL